MSANQVDASARIGRLLVVGLGSIGQRHARVARLIVPELRVVAWRHRESSEPLPADVERAVTSIDAALAFEPQVAVVASPATHHLASATALANAGVHLLVEKPIAASAAGVQELITLCAARGVVLMTGYNLRFLPSLKRFRELLADGIVGRVLSIRAEAGQNLVGWRPAQDYRNTVSARAALGGGVLLELSHEFDYLRWLFGEVAWVQATVRQQSALEIDVEDTAHVVLGFRERGEGAPVMASVSLDFIRHDSTRSCTVIGSEGTLRWNPALGTVDLFRVGGAWETLVTAPVERDASYLAEWRSFLASVESGRPAVVSGADGLGAVRIVDAARESSTREAVVHMDRFPVVES